MWDYLIYFFFTTLLFFLWLEYRRLLQFIDDLLSQLADKNAQLDKLEVENELLTFRNQVLARNKKPLNVSTNKNRFDDEDTVIVGPNSNKNLNTLAEEITSIKNILEKKFPDL